MSPTGMIAMRIAATLAHALPALTVRIRYRGETLLVVGHGPSDEGEPVSACAFRRAVACAHEQVKSGLRVGFLGVPTGDEPAIDVGVRPGDAAFPGGIYRVTVGDETIHGFATTLSMRHCRAVLEALPDGEHVVRLHHDAATEVTFVHTVTPADAAPSDAAHLIAAIEALGADEVIQELVAAR